MLENSFSRKLVRQEWNKREAGSDMRLELSQDDNWGMPSSWPDSQRHRSHLPLPKIERVGIAVQNQIQALHHQLDRDAPKSKAIPLVRRCANSAGT